MKIITVGKGGAVVVDTTGERQMIVFAPDGDGWKCAHPGKLTPVIRQTLDFLSKISATKIIND
jgi:hypothetical protein